MAMVDELIKDIARGVEYLDSHFTINVNDVHKPEGKSLTVRSLTPVSCCLLSAVFTGLHIHLDNFNDQVSTGWLANVNYLVQ